ncbi:MAG TPA: hypothetical protein VMH41_01750 [Mycobacteriales bacterium]|nr:hypothetical protein [Mycobacteriales bacterium]
MASSAACRDAIERLATQLERLDPQLRAKHLPTRSVLCRIPDLGIFFTAALDETGVHHIEEVSTTEPPTAEVKITVGSDELVALADGSDDLVGAWLHGRLQVSAPIRDILRLRGFIGM